MSVPDLYANMAPDLLGPAVHAAAVTPSDSADLAYVSKRLWVGTGGNVTVITLGGETVQYVAVPNGCYLQVRATRVKSTGTSASNIVAEY